MMHFTFFEIDEWYVSQHADYARITFISVRHTVTAAMVPAQDDCSCKALDCSPAPDAISSVGDAAGDDASSPVNEESEGRWKIVGAAGATGVFSVGKLSPNADGGRVSDGS